MTMEVGDLHNQEKIRLLIQATIRKAMLYPFLETQKKKLSQVSISKEGNKLHYIKE